MTRVNNEVIFEVENHQDGKTKAVIRTPFQISIIWLNPGQGYKLSLSESGSAEWERTTVE